MDSVLSYRRRRFTGTGDALVCDLFDTGVGQLEATIGSVASAVATMRVGLGEITVAVGDLSQRTEQQVASLEETVAALAEVTRGVDGTAGEAVKARNGATTALKNAEKGGAIVTQAVEAMSGIEASSNKIGSIIGVIDEIAFQINLASLIERFRTSQSTTKTSTARAPAKSPLGLPSARSLR